MDTGIFSDVDIFRRTLWGEARGEGYGGMHAVANVIMRRTKMLWQGEKSVRGICLHHAQFSCWNPDDPNRLKIFSISTVDQAYLQAIPIVNDALAGKLPDITNGADSYEVTGTDAYWAKGLAPVAVIGKHSFFRTV